MVVELAKELIGLNSENPPGNEREVARFIRDYLAGLGIESEILDFGKDRCDVVASVGRGDGLMLNGHIDTVPIGDMSLWEHDPFGEVVGDRLYGRGASDMKGGVACVLASIKGMDFKSAKRRLFLAFVGDEEAGFGGSMHLVKSRPDLLRGVRHGVIAEPTDMKIQVAQKGMVDLKVKFRGRSAHGSMPWLGDNAIYKAAKFTEKMEELGKSLGAADPVLGKGTINVGKISGGTKVNVIPDLCEVEIDRRLVAGETPESSIGQIKDVLRGLGLEAELQVVNAKPAFKVDDTSEILSIMKGITGAETFAATSYTEAELYKTLTGVDCVVFGPGNKETIHTSSEYVSIQNLRACSKAFGDLVRKWCF